MKDILWPGRTAFVKYADKGGKRVRAVERRHSSALWGSLFAILIIITIYTIWSFSMENWRVSNNQSSAALRLLEALANRVAFLRNILNATHLTEDELHQGVRKMAHFSEFAVYGLLSQGFLIAIRRLNGHNMVHGMSLGLLVAVIDETIQSTRDRGARVTDVLLDFCGVLFGCLVMWIIYGVFRLLSRSRE